MEVGGSHWLLRGPPCRFTWDRAVVSEVLHFGKWIFVSTGCTFLAEQADRLIVGQAASLATLGVYNVAVQLGLAARQVVSTITGKVVFPYYSRVLREGEGLHAALPRPVHPWAAGFAAFATAGLISAGPALIHWLYKKDYEAAGWMLQLVAISGWLTMLHTVSGCLLWVRADGHRSQALGTAVKALAAPVCAWVGLSLAGLAG